MKTITRLQNWIQLHCNDEWEHQHGVKIEMLDNPGWLISMSLKETALHNLVHFRSYNFEEDNGNLEHDWYDIRACDGKLNISCGPANLEQVLTIFLNKIIPKHADKRTRYDIYLPLVGSDNLIWVQAKAQFFNESKVKIIDIMPVEMPYLKAGDFSDFQCGYEPKTHHKIGDIVEFYSEWSFDGTILVAKTI